MRSDWEWYLDETTNVAICHERLSIVVWLGPQPINKDLGIVLSVNGEIYNCKN